MKSAESHPPLLASKVTSQLVLQALDDHLRRDQSAAVLWDGYDNIDAALADPRVRRTIDVRQEPVQVLEQLLPSDVVIYACTQDDHGLPFIGHLHALGRSYFPIWGARPEGYAFASSTARRTLEAEFAYQIEHGFAKWDFGYRDFENLIQAIEVTRHLSGSYLEVGCYRGSSAGVALRYLGATRRAIQAFFLDVFDGFNYAESKRSPDAVWHGTHVTDGLEAVRERLMRYGEGLPGLGITVARCNIITDPLPAEAVHHGIAVANLDVDLHEAVYAGLHKIAPHMVKGGVLIVEDPGHTPLLIGAKFSLERFLAEDGDRRFMPLVMQSGQTFLIRM